MHNEDCFTMIESYYYLAALYDFIALFLGIDLLDYDSSSMICTLEPGQSAFQGDLGECLIS